VPDRSDDVEALRSSAGEPVLAPRPATEPALLYLLPLEDTILDGVGATYREQRGADDIGVSIVCGG
jgi:hypothetical protein